jgi:hypothetical protein
MQQTHTPTQRMVARAPVTRTSVPRTDAPPRRSDAQVHETRALVQPVGARVARIDARTHRFGSAMRPDRTRVGATRCGLGWTLRPHVGVSLPRCENLACVGGLARPR